MNRIRGIALDNEYTRGEGNYTIIDYDIRDDDYYIQGVGENCKIGGWSDDYLYIHGFSSDEEIICGFVMQKKDGKPDFAADVFFKGIGKDKSERKIYIRTYISEENEIYELTDEDDFKLAFDEIIKPYIYELSEEFIKEYKELMKFFLPQLQACREYLNVMRNRTLNKATDFKNN